MHHTLLYVPGGLLAGALTLFAGSGPTRTPVAIDTARLSPRIQIDSPALPVSVNRTGKSDRLLSPSASILSAAMHEQREIATIEVNGGRAVSIVYRDRAGHVLFETDMAKRTTTVAKGVAIPEATVRMKKDGAPRDSYETPRQPAVGPVRAPPSKLLSGCDPLFSPIVNPALANVAGRCLAALSGTQTVAALTF